MPDIQPFTLHHLLWLLKEAVDAGMHEIGLSVPLIRGLLIRGEMTHENMELCGRNIEPSNPMDEWAWSNRDIRNNLGGS